MLPKCPVGALTHPTPGIISRTRAVAVIMKPISPDYGVSAVSESHFCATPTRIYFIIDVQVLFERVSACRLGAVVRHQQGCAMGTLSRHPVSWWNEAVFCKTLWRTLKFVWSLQLSGKFGSQGTAKRASLRTRG